MGRWQLRSMYISALAIPLNTMVSFKKASVVASIISLFVVGIHLHKNVHRFPFWQSHPINSYNRTLPFSCIAYTWLSFAKESESNHRMIQKFTLFKTSVHLPKSARAACSLLFTGLSTASCNHVSYKIYYTRCLLQEDGNLLLLLITEPHIYT